MAKNKVNLLKRSMLPHYERIEANPHSKAFWKMANTDHYVLLKVAYTLRKQFLIFPSLSFIEYGENSWKLK